MTLARELSAALALRQSFGVRAAAAYLNVRGWSMATALRVLI